MTKMDFKRFINGAEHLVQRGALRTYSNAFVRGRKVVDNKVIFSSFSGRGYSCSPKYICEELHRRNLDIELVWAIQEGYEVPSFIRPVRYGSLQAQAEWASARVWVDNTRGEKCISKKADQLYIQTWHGMVGGVKKVERDAADSLTPTYKALAKADGRQTDLMMANNAISAEIIKRSFWFSGSVLKCGAPRNRPLLGNTQRYSSIVHEFYGIDSQVKLCLYAPTFRKDGVPAAFALDWEALRFTLKMRFGGEFAIMLRLHPNLTTKYSVSGDESIVDASKYPDPQELIAASDVLITDYSSIGDDFLLLNRPGFIFAPDIDSYESSDRGFYYPLSEKPYAIATDSASLFDAIANFDEDEFTKRRSEYLDFLSLYEDGMGASVVADIIEAIICNKLTLEQALASVSTY